jgi:hypothetical protein
VKTHKYKEPSYKISTPRPLNDMDLCIPGTGNLHDRTDTDYDTPFKVFCSPVLPDIKGNKAVIVPRFRPLVILTVTRIKKKKSMENW